MSERLIDADVWKLYEQAKRYRSHAKQATENANGRYTTIAQRAENLERAARLTLEADGFQARAVALERSRQ